MSSRLLRRLLAAVPAVLIAASPTLAHPDIAITARILFDMKDRKLAGIAMQWSFDPSYSRRLAKGFDKDGDGAFSDLEAKALGQQLVSDLSPHAFFISLSIAGHRQPVGSPNAVDVVLQGNIVTVTTAFQISDLSASGAAAELILRDPDYTAAFKLAEDSPAIVRGDNRRCETRIERRPEQAYFGRLVVPQAVVLVCR